MSNPPHPKCPFMQIRLGLLSPDETASLVNQLHTRFFQGASFRSNQFTAPPLSISSPFHPVQQTQEALPYNTSFGPLRPQHMGHSLIARPIDSPTIARTAPAPHMNPIQPNISTLVDAAFAESHSSSSPARKSTDSYQNKVLNSPDKTVTMTMTMTVDSSRMHSHPSKKSRMDTLFPRAVSMIGSDESSSEETYTAFDKDAPLLHKPHHQSRHRELQRLDSGDSGEICRFQDTKHRESFKESSGEPSPSMLQDPRTQAPQNLAPENGIEWTPSMDSKLTTLVQTHGADSWAIIASGFGSKVSENDCLLRWNEIGTSSIHKGKWTEEEDRCLARAVREIGDYAWRKIAPHVPNRVDVQCRHRWVFWTTFVDRLLKKGLGRLPDLNPYGTEKASGLPVVWSGDWDSLPIAIILPISIICLKIKSQIADKHRTVHNILMTQTPSPSQSPSQTPMHTPTRTEHDVKSISKPALAPGGLSKQITYADSNPIGYEEQPPSLAYNSLSAAYTTEEIIEFARGLIFGQHRPTPSNNQQMTFNFVSRWISNRLHGLIPYGAHIQEKHGVVVATDVFILPKQIHPQIANFAAFNSKNPRERHTAALSRPRSKRPLSAPKSDVLDPVFP